jgi:phthalate 4,5-cis-dihydrodiol dehydrogenase
MVAAHDPRAEALARFVAEFGAAGHATADALCADPHVDVVYVASPHQFHLEHVRLAAAHGKHVLVEKPMALTVAQGLAMIETASRAGTQLIVGHSHSFDAPYLRTRQMIDRGEFGAVRMITALNYTDFLYRPRRPEELDTASGGGVVFSQAAHQIDVVRLLAGAQAQAVRAFTGRWDPARPTEGAYSAQMRFADGAFASLTYSGYAHFDSDEFNGWWGELGARKSSDAYGAARRALAQVRSPAEELAMKNLRAYGARDGTAFTSPAGTSHNHFGLIIVSCERADLRPTPDGIMVYGDTERRFVKLEPPAVPRAEVIDELWSAVVDRRTPLHSGQWGLATLEACLAILRSSHEGREIALSHQS